MNLPEAFLSRMHEYFQNKGTPNEEADFLASFESPAYRGIRLNRMKVSQSEYEDCLGELGLDKNTVPWCDGGFYSNIESPGKDAYYHAGVYYVQEPSAMLPAAVLGTIPGEKILDMCAAPGGKATRIAEDLRGEGLLVANEISADRARALLRNIERIGANNVVILNENPANMVSHFRGYFDRILIDAPCSGEGMFRRDDFACKSWEKFGPSSCMPIQKEILGYADEMLCAGGSIVYSTCTFCEGEDEDMISAFLTEHANYEIVSHREIPGITHANNGMMRVWPHKSQGDGHFCVHLRKNQQATPNDICQSQPFQKESDMRRKNSFTYNKSKECFLEFSAEIMTPEAYKAYSSRVDNGFILHKDKVHLLGTDEAIFDGLRVIKMGDFPGEIKETGKGRVFIPSQSLALSLQKADISKTHFLSLARNDERLIRYLRGETIMLTEEETDILAANAHIVIAAGKYPLGFAKTQGATLKNLYPKAWRLQ